MSKKEIRTDLAPLPAGPYSQGLAVANRVYVSGQRPESAATGTIPEDFTDQARQCLDNVRSILEAGGAAMDDVVMVTVYLSDLANFAAFNEVYKTYFKPPFPTRTTIGCQLRNIMVEVTAVAEVGGK